MTNETSLSDVALLAPVSAGKPLRVLHGYNDPLPNQDCHVGGGGADHCNNQRYGLDLISSEQQDLEILAPLPGRIAWTSGDCLGVRTRDNLNLTICHFAKFFVQPNDEVSHGTVLGTRKTPWIHVSLDNRYQDASKPPVPFNGRHTLEGISFEPGGENERNVHVGRTFISTNGSGGPELDCARFVKDLTHPDGTPVSPGTTFRKGWQVQNCGMTTWRAYQAVRVGGGYGPTSFDVPIVGPDSLGELWTDIAAPSEPGIHRATYQIKGPNGNFGKQFWVEIDVRSP